VPVEGSLHTDYIFMQIKMTEIKTRAIRKSRNFSSETSCRYAYEGMTHRKQLKADKKTGGKSKENSS